VDRREHPLALHRLVPVLVVVLLAAAAFFALRGPSWYQRLYHPLKHEALIARESSATDLDPYLVAASINVESGFDPGTVSGAGAVGLMQVLPSTARQVARRAGHPTKVTVESLKDPELNVFVGTRYLADRIAQYGATDVGLAAYNAGSVAVDRWLAESRRSGRPFRDVVDFPETRHYIDEVLAQREVYATLYPEAFKEAQ